MKLMPDDLPDDPVLLKQMLLEAQDAKEAYATHIVDLKEQIKLLRDRIFGRKSEQTVEPNKNAVVNANHCRLIFPASKSFTNCPSTN
ncbi:ISPsy5, transposase [Pseudomonas syringae pv. actinidiae ICMP 19070]|nr:ISPsy5, transposase [Pseudomonas syringae pv. actinidiae ICMP 19070]